MWLVFSHDQEHYYCTYVDIGVILFHVMVSMRKLLPRPLRHYYPRHIFTPKYEDILGINTLDRSDKIRLVDIFQSNRAGHTMVPYAEGNYSSTDSDIGEEI